MDWQTKRKLTLISVIGGVVFIMAALVVFFFWYEEPTCTDGIQNQDEAGVDCGGSCGILCPDTVSEPLVLWERALSVTGKGVYNLVAFVENPNDDAYLPAISYEFRVYDKNNTLLGTVDGRTNVPAGKTFAIFEGNYKFEREPARVTFEFIGNPSWLRANDTRDRFLRVSQQQLVNQDANPRINAILENVGTQEITDIEIVAIVYDSDNNAIGSSRTIVSALPGRSERQITFTWPEPFKVGTRICEQPANVMLALDRSGSMNDDQLDPPQPLSAVKEAASSFIDKLANKDRAGVVSFASKASEPIDMPLTNEFEKLKEAIQAISIAEPDREQHTNIFDGISAAHRELNSLRRSEAAADVIVLLTDGIATRPLPPEGEKGTTTEEYPKTKAREAAQAAQNDNKELYIIGLGSEVESGFLESLALTQEHYFFAPQTEELDQIYQSIATSICKKGAAIIRVIPRIRGTSE